MHLNKNNEIIPAMVRRHVEDAAFYWSQYDGSENSTLLQISDLIRFENILRAHLDGIQIAGNGAWPFAIMALERWNKPGEAFACACTAVLQRNVIHLDAFAAYLQTRPDELIRGAISALAWIPWSAAEYAVRRWTTRESDPVKLVIALRSLYLIKNCLVTDSCSSDSAQWLHTPLSELLEHQDPHVRAAACRLSSMEDEDEQIKKLLTDKLHDADLAVRAQASIAVARLAQRGAYVSRHDELLNESLAIQSAEILQRCIVDQISLMAGKTGGFATQAQRRIYRWVENLAWMIKPGARDLTAMLSLMPPRIALNFVAFHGDPAYLDFVIKHMDDPALARYAGWVWQIITGIDLDESGLALSEPDFSSDLPLQPAPAGNDVGLAIPNVPAIVKTTPLLQKGQRYFNGHVIAFTHILEIMESGTQVVRSIAAQHLQTLDSLFIISVRAPAETQISCLNAINELMALEGTT